MIHIPLPPANDPLWVDLRALAGPAVAGGPAAGVDRMHAAGLLALGLGDGRGLPAPEALRLATLLRRLGRADLVMARLFEGHVNALKLIALHGAPDVAAKAFAQAAAGRLFGVWGADGGRAAACGPTDDGRSLLLTGAKRFCSGLGVVSRAVVPVAGDGGAQLLLVPVDDPARSDPAAWQASAMRASVSGGYVLDGLALPPEAALGRPGVYATEPWFEGGIWRYGAAHVGGAEALVALATATLAGQGRDSHPVQAARLATAAMHAEAARRMIEAAAVAVEGAADAGGAAVAVEGAADAGGDAVPRAVALALLAREFTEGACLEVIRLTERALGMGAQIDGQDADRIRRDLSLFLRQANPDGKLESAARLLREGGWPAGEAW